MDSTDVTIKILEGIRAEAQQTNARLDQANAGIDETNADIKAMHAGLSRRIVESEIRTATAIADLAGTVREMTSVLRAQHDLRPRVERCEQDIIELKQRLSK